MKWHRVSFLFIVIAGWAFSTAVTASESLFDDSQTQTFRFSTYEQFRQRSLEEYLAYHNADHGAELYTLYRYDDAVSIITIVGSEGLSPYLYTPILMVWRTDSIILAKPITWVTGLRDRLHHFELTGVEKIIDRNTSGSSFAIMTHDSIEEFHIGTHNLHSHCEVTNNIYFVELDTSTKSINLLTSKPIILNNEVKPATEDEWEKCEADLKDGLAIESNEKTFLIKETKNPITPLQKPWVGQYTTRAGKLFRVGDLTKYYQQLQEADAQAIKYFRDNKKELAIAILEPLIEYGPDVLDSNTVSAYNNYAFFLSDDIGELNSNVIPMLERIVAQFPDREVAHLNLADAYYEVRKKDNAERHYRTYIRLLGLQNKQTRIPKRVRERVSE